ncbi:MAG: hypothetical protein ACK4FG_04315 [Brevundimonas sp.]|jgi:hypothetical protein
MKTLPIIALSALALSACAGGVPPRAFDTAATEWTGWVKFTGEEFELYADEDQVLQPFSRPCLSGALPRDLQRQAAGDLSGQEVRVTGTVAPWAASTRTLDRAGSTITNTCGGSVVVLAETMAPI